MNNYIILILFLILHFAHQIDSVPVYPIVILHGMTEHCENWRNNIASKFERDLKRPSFCIEFLEDPSKEYFTSILIQAKNSCNIIQNIKEINDAEFYDIVGLSQGNMVARYIIQICDIKAKPRRFISIGGPLSGIVKIPNCEQTLKNAKFLCTLGDYLLGKLAYTVQDNVDVIGYLRIPSSLNNYKKNSNFLAILNNERLTSLSEQIKNRFSNLELVVCIKFLKDETIQPNEIEWFGSLDNNSIILKMEETETYKNDLYGLKTLNESGRIKKFSINSQHLKYTNEEFDNFVTHFLYENYEDLK